MKLREFKFKELPRFCGLAIGLGEGKWVAEGFVGEVLRNKDVIALADAEITDTRWFFDTFVIEVKKGGEGNNEQCTAESPAGQAETDAT